jgi:hypothetical protein
VFAAVKFPENQSFFHPRAVTGYETFTPFHPLLGACRTCKILQQIAAKFSDLWAPFGVCKVKMLKNRVFSHFFYLKRRSPTNSYREIKRLARENAALAKPSIVN